MESRGLNRSRTIVRTITMPAQPASAWKKRTAIGNPTEGASTARSEASAQTVMPIVMGSRRPNRSESGPTTICPHGQPDEIAGRRELHRPLRHAELVGNRRETDQVHVDREGSDSRQAAEDGRDAELLLLGYGIGESKGRSGHHSANRAVVEGDAFPPGRAPIRP